MSNKGIIVNVKKNHIVVLTDSGEFIRVQKKNHAPIGRGIAFTNDDIINSSGIRKDILKMNKKIIGIAAAVILVTAFLLGSAIWGPGLLNTPVYALVTIDINPSVEIEIDDQNIVIDIIHLNDDAADITNAEMIGKELLVVIDEMIVLAEEKGYLVSDDNNILISSTVLDEGDSGGLADLITEYLQNNLELDTTVKVFYIQSNEEIADDAHEQEVSMGKLALIRITNSDSEDNDEIFENDDMEIYLSGQSFVVEFDDSSDDDSSDDDSSDDDSSDDDSSDDDSSDDDSSDDDSSDDDSSDDDSSDDDSSDDDSSDDDSSDDDSSDDDSSDDDSSDDDSSDDDSSDDDSSDDDSSDDDSSDDDSSDDDSSDDDSSDDDSSDDDSSDDDSSDDDSSDDDSSDDDSSDDDSSDDGDSDDDSSDDDSSDDDSSDDDSSDDDSSDDDSSEDDDSDDESDEED